MSKRNDLEAHLNRLTAAFQFRTAMIYRHWRPVQALVPVSGGKDSQACLKLAVDTHGASNVLGLFCDTQFEHPDTYVHVRFIAELYGVQIATVTAGDVLERSVRYGRFPGGGSRHCTDDLKIKPTKVFCSHLSLYQGPFEVWYGMRLEESTDREKRYAGLVADEVHPPHEVLPSKYPKYLAKRGVMFRLPVLNWSELDIFDYLEGKQHPHYELGFPRVGCFPCLAAGDRWKEKAFAHDLFGASQKHKVIKISAQIGKSIWTSKGGVARNDDVGCEICAR